jgi:hypothetical protein
VKTLLLGASHSDFPIAQLIKSCDHQLFTAGTYREGLSNTISDSYHSIDYSDYDACAELVSKIRPDYIVPSANDFSYLTALCISDWLYPNRLDSIESAKTIHYKDRFRLYCHKHSISSPALYQIVDKNGIHKINSVSYPCMVKSVDLTGGKGICLVKNKADLSIAINDSISTSLRSTCVVEEFLPNAHLFSLSAFYREGHLHDCYLDQETLYPGTFGVTSSTWPPTRAIDINPILDQLRYICCNLSLKPGLIHAQIVDSCGKLYIIEITRRLPGDLYSIPVQAATGIQHARNALSGWLPGVRLPDLNLDNYLPGLDSSRVSSISRYQAYLSEEPSHLQENSFSSADYVSSFVKGKRLNLGACDLDTKGVVFIVSYKN